MFVLQIKLKFCITFSVLINDGKHRVQSKNGFYKIMYKHKGGRIQLL